MKSVSLSGSLRENVGKKDAKKQRKEGKVPCVVYGGKEQIHFTIEELAFGSIIFTPEVYIVNLNIDGKEVRAILQEVQYHPVTDKPLHADFLQVFDDKIVSVAIPTKLVGDSIGVMKGGKLIHKIHRVVVKGLIKDIPDAIEVDITKLDIGKSIKIRDLSVDKLVLTDPANSVIVRTKTARNLEDELVDDEDEEGEETAETPAEETPAAE